MIGGPTREVASITLGAFLLIGLLEFTAVRLQGHHRSLNADLDRRSFQFIRLTQVMGFVVGASAPRFVPSLMLSNHVWWPVSIGLLIATAGAVLRLWAIFTLGASFRRLVTMEPGDRLVIKGPYRYLRHPAYSGVILTFLGLGLAFDNGLGFALVLIPLPAYLYRIKVEQQALNQIFGDAYQRYSQKTRSLIPGVW